MGRRKRTVPEAVSIQLAATILDVHQVTIRRWIKGGYIKAYRVGPYLIRIPRSEIVRMRAVRIPYQIHGDRPEYPSV